MKRLLFIAGMLPLLALAQKVKINEYDKFIRQARVEVEPLSILSTEKASVSMSYAATGNSLFVVINGAGWGPTTVDQGNEVIFLFSNDSTVTVKSPVLQLYDAGSTRNSYKHKYGITVPDLEVLSQYDLVGVRKYGFRDYEDLTVTKANALKIKKLSSLFIEELKKARIIRGLRNIDVRQAAKYVGDTVRFCSKIFTARYFETSEKKPTLLDVNPDFGSPLVNLVIWGDDRKNFSKPPELLYANKEVCICGLVQMNNNVPQIVIHSMDQVKVQSPVDVAEAVFFIGDTLTVTGKVISAKYIAGSENSATLLNLGAAYPDQLLTVVIEKKDRPNFMDAPERYYVDKEVSITGRVVLYNDKPQIVVQSRAQIKEVKEQKAKFAKADQNSQKPVTQEAAVKEIFTGRQAEFPGGATAWAEFLKENLRCPPGMVAGEKQTVTASFLVSPRGEVSNINIVTSAGKLFDNEVMRVLKRMPRWLPITVSGKPIGSMITQKITFEGIEEDAKKAF